MIATMAELSIDDLGTTDDGLSKSTSRTVQETKEYHAFDDGVVSFLIWALEQKGEDVSFPLNCDDAAEFTDEYKQHFGIDSDIDKQCVKEMAPFGIDADYVGTAVNVTKEQLQQSVEAGVLSQDAFDSIEFDDNGVTKWAPDGIESTPQSDLSMMLNGFHAEEITDAFGPNAKVRVMAGKRSAFDAAHKRYTNVRFYVSTSTQAPFSRERARLTVGEITQSEFEQWAQKNGFGDKL